MASDPRPPADATEPATARLRAEDGNTLVLMPAAVLVLLVLAAIAFDGAAVYLQQRRLADLAASLANDVVAGLDPASLYDTVRDPDIDPGRAADLAHARLAAFGRDRTLQDVHCTPAVDGSQVTVSCEAVVRATFGRALAPDRGTYRVRAVESARAAVS